MTVLKDYDLPEGLLKLDIAPAYYNHFADRGTDYVPSREIEHKYFFPVSSKGEFIDRLGHPITAERIAGTCFHSDSEGYKQYYNESQLHKKDAGIPELNVFRHCASLIEKGQDIVGIGVWYNGAPFVVSSFDFTNGFAKDVCNPVEEQSLIAVLEDDNTPSAQDMRGATVCCGCEPRPSATPASNKKEIKARENGKYKFLNQVAFEAAIREWAALEYGIDLPYTLVVGQETKCQTLNDKGKRQSENEFDATYYYEANGPCRFIMVYNYEISDGGGISNFNKKLCSEHSCDCSAGIDTANYKAFCNRMRQVKQEYDLKREEGQKQAQIKAIELFKTGTLDFSSCPYLEKKGFNIEEFLRDNRLYFKFRMLSNGTLLIPVRHPDFGLNDISCLQTININREKQKLFTKHGKTKGGFVYLPAPRSECKEIILCEGVATGLSIWYAMPCHVFCCLNAGGLIAVAKELKEGQISELPSWGEEITQEHRITICADNDQYPDKNGKPKKNTGVESAMLAADILEATYVVPTFIDTTGKPTDFNDLDQLEGPNTVRTQIEQNQQIAPSLDLVKQATMTSEEYLAYIQHLPIINLYPDKMDYHARQIEELLSHGTVFQRGGKLYRLRKVTIGDNRLSSQRDENGNLKPSLSYSAGSAILEEITPQIAPIVISKYVHFAKQDKRHQNDDGTPVFVSCRIPAALTNDFLSLESWPHVRPCEVLAHCPIVTPEGKVIFRVGYDRQTQVYLDIPANLKLNMGMSVSEAKAWIDSAIEEYCFKSDIDRAGAIAGILTPFIRPLITTSPCFVISADTAGTGKSTLAEQIGIIATGEKPDTLSWNTNPQERDKSFDSHLLSASPILLMDNIPNEYEFNDSKINSVITQGRTSIRLFCTQHTMEVDVRSVLIMTGNHLHTTDDMTRRSILIKMHSDDEHPETRVFKKDILEWCKKNRSNLVSAVIVLLSAFLTNKELVKRISQELSPLNGFTQWSKIVRGAVYHYWVKDPYESMAQAKEDDPERSRRLSFLQEWVALYGIDAEYTVKEVLRDADSMSLQYETLRECIQELVTVRLSGDDLPTPRDFGKIMRKLEGQNIGGLMVQFRKDTHAHRNYWKVTKIR